MHGLWGHRLDSVKLAAVRDHVCTAAAFRETKLTVTLKTALVEIEIPDPVDRYGLANVILQEPISRQVLQAAREQIELLSGASRVNEDVAIHIYGPHGPSIPVTA